MPGIMTIERGSSSATGALTDLAKCLTWKGSGLGWLNETMLLALFVINGWGEGGRAPAAGDLVFFCSLKSASNADRL